jgi:septal ring factor EnvC (AmiA/AmiB activator)
VQLQDETLEEIRENIEHSRTLIREYQKRLRVLEVQSAQFGYHVPPHIQLEIDDLNSKINKCKQYIRDYQDLWYDLALTERSQRQCYATQLKKTKLTASWT